MKIVTIKVLWLLHLRNKFHINISSRLWVIGVSNVENRTHTHTHTHTHTSGRQLKIPFLDVLDYSEYSDTNISKKNFFTKTASSVRKQNSLIFQIKQFRIFDHFKISQLLQFWKWLIFQIINFWNLNFLFNLGNYLNFKNQQILELFVHSIFRTTRNFADYHICPSI